MIMFLKILSRRNASVFILNVIYDIIATGTAYLGNAGCRYLLQVEFGPRKHLDPALAVDELRPSALAVAPC